MHSAADFLTWSHLFAIIQEATLELPIAMLLREEEREGSWRDDGSVDKNAHCASRKSGIQVFSTYVKSWAWLCTCNQVLGIG